MYRSNCCILAFAWLVQLSVGIVIDDADVIREYGRCIYHLNGIEIPDTQHVSVQFTDKTRINIDKGTQLSFTTPIARGADVVTGVEIMISATAMVEDVMSYEAKIGPNTLSDSIATKSLMAEFQIELTAEHKYDPVKFNVGLKNSDNRYTSFELSLDCPAEENVSGDDNGDGVNEEDGKEKDPKTSQGEAVTGLGVVMRSPGMCSYDLTATSSPEGLFPARSYTFDDGATFSSVQNFELTFRFEKRPVAKVELSANVTEPITLNILALKGFGTTMTDEAEFPTTDGEPVTVLSTPADVPLPRIRSLIFDWPEGQIEQLVVTIPCEDQTDENTPGDSNPLEGEAVTGLNVVMRSPGKCSYDLAAPSFNGLFRARSYTFDNGATFRSDQNYKLTFKFAKQPVGQVDLSAEVSEPIKLKITAPAISNIPEIVEFPVVDGASPVPVLISDGLLITSYGELKLTWSGGEIDQLVVTLPCN